MSIQVEGSLLSFNGTLMFESNAAHPEGVSGVLYLSSYAQILLNENVSVSFVNNSGRLVSHVVITCNLKALWYKLQLLKNVLVLFLSM